MTDQLKYRAKINAKGLDTTGVTEDHARALASRLGSHIMLVCEGRATTVVTDEEGNQQVALILTQVEPVPDAQEDSVREFLRALYRDRSARDGDTLPGTSDGPTVDAAARGIAAHVDRDDDGNHTGKGIWDGDLDAPLGGAEGQAQVTLPAKKVSKVGSPFQVVSDQDPDLCPEPGCSLPQHDEGDHVASDG